MNTNFQEKQMRQLDSSLLIRINRTDKDEILKSFGTNNVSEYLRDKLYEYHEKTLKEGKA